MKALVMVFTFTFLLLCVTPMAISEIVTIDAGLLPGVGASYVHCWAAAGSSTNTHVPFPGGRTDLTGADIPCNASKTTLAGDSASAHARAKVTGGVVLEANVPASGNSMNKVAFAAAAAYAQGGGQIKKTGQNRSSLMVVYISGLKVTGHQDPIDDEVRLEVTNLKPKQINQTIIQEVVRDQELLDRILSSVGHFPGVQSEFQLIPFTGEPYLKIQARITAENEFAVTASAPLLCDPRKLKEAGVDVHNLSSPSVRVQEAVEKVLDHYLDFCSRQDNVVQRSSFDVKSNKDNNGSDIHMADQKNKLEYVIVIPKNTDAPESNDFSVNTIQFTSSRKPHQPNQPTSQ